MYARKGIKASSRSFYVEDIKVLYSIHCYIPAEDLALLQQNSLLCFPVAVLCYNAIVQYNTMQHNADSWTASDEVIKAYYLNPSLLVIAGVSVPVIYCLLAACIMVYCVLTSWFHDIFLWIFFIPRWPPDPHLPPNYPSVPHYWQVSLPTGDYFGDRVLEILLFKSKNPCGGTWWRMGGFSWC